MAERDVFLYVADRQLAKISMNYIRIILALCTAYLRLMYGLSTGYLRVVRQIDTVRKKLPYLPQYAMVMAITENKKRLFNEGLPFYTYK